jgi:very-short-patch-repair endonuclease
MRHAATPSEAALWAALRGGALKVTFRRQVPLAGRFIGDFIASELKLVVEVDSSSHHARATADARRDRELQRLGFTVVRLPVTLVENNLSDAVQCIRDTVEASGARSKPGAEASSAPVASERLLVHSDVVGEVLSLRTS